MKNVIFIAPPAAGKGTLSDFLEKKYGYVHISSGDLFREKIKEQDEEAKELEKILASGKLVDDNRLFSLIKNKLQKEKEKKFVLDGVPRTLQQAKNLDIILHDLGFSDYIIIYIHVDEEILKKRMTGRRTCPKCKKIYNIYFEKFKPNKELICDQCEEILIQRSDDQEESFKIRYEIFKENSEPILNYYREQSRLYELDNSEEDHRQVLMKLQRIVGAIID